MSPPTTPTQCPIVNFWSYTSWSPCLNIRIYLHIGPCGNWQCTEVLCQTFKTCIKVPYSPHWSHYEDGKINHWLPKMLTGSTPYLTQNHMGNRNPNRSNKPFIIVNKKNKIKKINLCVGQEGWQRAIVETSEWGRQKKEGPLILSGGAISCFAFFSMRVWCPQLQDKTKSAGLHITFTQSTSTLWWATQIHQTGWIKTTGFEDQNRLALYYQFFCTRQVQMQCKYKAQTSH